MKAGFQLRVRVWLCEQSYVQHLTLCGEARPERTSASLECDYYKLIHPCHCNVGTDVQPFCVHMKRA